MQNKTSITKIVSHFGVKNVKFKVIFVSLLSLLLISLTELTDEAKELLLLLEQSTMKLDSEIQSIVIKTDI